MWKIFCFRVKKEKKNSILPSCNKIFKKLFVEKLQTRLQVDVNGEQQTSSCDNEESRTERKNILKEDEDGEKLRHDDAVVLAAKVLSILTESTLKEQSCSKGRMELNWNNFDCSLFNGEFELSWEGFDCSSLNGDCDLSWNGFECCSYNEEFELTWDSSDCSSLNGKFDMSWDGFDCSSLNEEFDLSWDGFECYSYNEELELT